MRLSNDPEVVRREYASERGLLERSSIYANVDGEDALEVVSDLIAELNPRSVLEVGCGTGSLAQRLSNALDCEITALDISPRMVELTRERGISAELGDVQTLRFTDGEFDCVIAAWMLYHVPDLDRGLSEIGRVLSPEGSLVAVTVGVRHLEELWALVGQPGYNVTFNDENGAQILGRHFASVRSRSVKATVTFDDRGAARRYIAASITRSHLADQVPELTEPLRATTWTCVFVASKA